MYANPKSDPALSRAFSAAFGEVPRECRILPFRPMRLDSYWSGGSKSWFAVANMGTGEVARSPESGNGFTPYDEKGGIGITELPPGCILLEKHASGVKTFWTAYGEIAPQLSAPAQDELSPAERRVLACMKSYKPAFRREYAKLTQAEYDSAIERLKTRGYVNNQNALTLAGKNVAVELDEYKHPYSY